MSEDICAVNRSRKICLSDNDAVYPIIHWLDDCGDECEAKNAVVCVAKVKEKFVVLDLREFDNVQSN